MSEKSVKPTCRYGLAGVIVFATLSISFGQVKDDGVRSPGAAPDPSGSEDNSALTKEKPDGPEKPGAADLVPARFDPSLPKQSDGASGPHGRDALEGARTLPSKRYGIDLNSVPEISLAALDHEALLKEDAKVQPGGKRIRISVGRDVQITSELGLWHEVPGVGRVWSLDVVSAGALGLRLHVTDFELPPGAELWVYAPSHPEGADGPHQGRGPLDDGRFWSGTTEGDRVRVELFTPGDAVRGAIEPPRIDQLQHLYRDPVADTLAPDGACDNDVTCFSTWTNVSHGTTRLSFVENGSGFLCTGQLVNPQNGDLTPYVLTSNSCIATNAVANTTQFFWLYQTAACNGTPPSLSSVPKSSVGTLSVTGASSDFTILMEEGSLPCGLFWPGFDANAIATGLASSCIHHPGGGAKRISFGTKATADSSVCSTGSPNFVRVNWTDGGVASGSEGAAVYRNDTQRVYGQFSCGSTTCGGATFDNFGAMSATYGGSTTVQTLLAGGSDDALEPNDTCATAVTITEGTFSNRIVKFNHDDWFRITIPAGGQLAATLSFTHANGNIDMELFSTCGGTMVASSSGTTNTESFVYTNTGAAAAFLLHVFLSDCDTRNTYTMVLSASLPNDTCAAATVIPGATTTFTPAPYSVTLADASVSEPQEACEVSNVGVSNTVWYSFTPCGSGTIRVDTFGSNFDTVLSLFTGTCTAATQVACSDNAIGTQARLLDIPVNAGTTYLIKVADYNTTAGGGTLDFNFSYTPTEPANDTCAAPGVIPSNATAFNPTPYCTVGATTTVGDPAETCGFTSNSNSVWYTYSPCADGTITVDTNGSDYDTVLAIFTGSCGSGTELACDDDSGTGLNSQLVHVPVTAGTTYLIKVSDFGNPDGGTLDFNFSFAPSAPPDNDDCSSPTYFSGDATSFNPPPYCTVGANATFSEPQESCEVGGVGVSNTVWYSFTACGNGTVSLDTNGSDYDTVLSLFSGSCGAAVQVACDDDSGTGANSQLTNVPVTAGTTYLVKVADYGGPNGGTLVFHETYVAAAPANDLCSAATLVPANIYNPATYCTVGATVTAGDPAETCGPPPNSNSVWYRFVPGQTGPVTINTHGSDYSTVVALFSGTCAAPTRVACGSSGGPQTEVTAVLNAGTSYLIKVSDLGSAGGGSLGFNLAFGDNGAGEVPSGGLGQPLRLAKSGQDVALSWDPSCLATDSDYAVYEGTLGVFYSHASLFCSTGGSTSIAFMPPDGSAYYLVVPSNGPREGSYGSRSNGSQRPAGGSACVPQALASCP